MLNLTNSHQQLELYKGSRGMIVKYQGEIKERRKKQDGIKEGRHLFLKCIYIIYSLKNKYKRNKLLKRPKSVNHLKRIQRIFKRLLSPKNLKEHNLKRQTDNTIQKPINQPSNQSFIADIRNSIHKHNEKFKFKVKFFY